VRPPVGALEPAAAADWTAWRICPGGSEGRRLLGHGGATSRGCAPVVEDRVAAGQDKTSMAAKSATAHHGQERWRRHLRSFPALRALSPEVVVRSGELPVRRRWRAPARRCARVVVGGDDKVLDDQALSSTAAMAGHLAGQLDHDQVGRSGRAALDEPPERHRRRYRGTGRLTRGQGRARSRMPVRGPPARVDQDVDPVAGLDEAAVPMPVRCWRRGCRGAQRRHSGREHGGQPAMAAAAAAGWSSPPSSGSATRRRSRSGVLLGRGESGDGRVVSPAAS